MEYRAISLHQPWASLVALEIKKYETRSWGTKFRGKLLICSAKKKYTPDQCFVNKVFDLADMGTFHRTRLNFLGKNTKYTEFLPMGKVLCVVDLVSCWEMKSRPKRGEYYNSRGDAGIVTLQPRNGVISETVTELERLCGDWQDGRFAWELENTKALYEPISIKGKQGLWIPDLSIIEEVETQLQKQFQR